MFLFIVQFFYTVSLHSIVTVFAVTRTHFRGKLRVIEGHSWYFQETDFFFMATEIVTHDSPCEIVFLLVNLFNLPQNDGERRQGHQITKREYQLITLLSTQRSFSLDECFKLRLKLIRATAGGHICL